jgi:hypothetical protein
MKIMMVCGKEVPVEAEKNKRGEIDITVDGWYVVTIRPDGTLFDLLQTDIEGRVLTVRDDE